MKERLSQWLYQFGVPEAQVYYLLSVATLILAVSLVLHLILHRVVLRFMARGQQAARRTWRKILLGHHLFSRLALVLQGVVVFAMADTFLEPGGLLLAFVETVTHLWIILFSLLALFSLLDAIEEMSLQAGSKIKLPLRGIFQSLKLAATTVALIFAIAFLIGKSPVILFSGLGAMTAVILLIFKDPILGLVAGIQLSANNMLAVGDWLEMPDYGADGEVIDISLTTVKVMNWDKTITSIPSYTLISDSFKNWRNIEHVKGRRIKRAIRVDATSVGFVSEDDLARLSEIPLLAEHIDRKRREIRQANEARGESPESIVTARRMTNLGLLRAYLEAYLAESEHINQKLTRMVRQLEAGPHGIPVQLYAFANRTDWTTYENIQSDIFDHVYAIVPFFGLRLHQAPSGHDVSHLGRALHDGTGRSDLSRAA